ncbi:hypothetical protein OG500_06160 [Kitasatospora sp. NBC_01250]|uniref:hypothetical protein n=1 Tax=unclassified Kitasatospora TaxID=2633591 RepID=UPI002E168707|nr:MULTISPECIES: hypothetical protein [unclassified Kitasatospora]WSJ65701.1 hypothetical protein OG294_06030 [Kitasatospora sp. NBC_01302]
MTLTVLLLTVPPLLALLLCLTDPARSRETASRLARRHRRRARGRHAAPSARRAEAALSRLA